MKKVLDGIVAPGVLYGNLSVHDGKLFYAVAGKKEKAVNLTVGQVAQYSKARRSE